MTQKYQFVAAHASEDPLTVLCRVLGLARSGSYAWRNRPLTARVPQDQQLTADIQRICTNSRQTDGSRACMPSCGRPGRVRVSGRALDAPG